MDYLELVLLLFVMACAGVLGYAVRVLTEMRHRQQAWEAADKLRQEREEATAQIMALNEMELRGKSQELEERAKEYRSEFLRIAQEAGIDIRASEGMESA